MSAGAPFSPLNQRLVSGRASPGALLAEVMCTGRREKKRYSGRTVLYCCRHCPITICASFNE